MLCCYLRFLLLVVAEFVHGVHVMLVLPSTDHVINIVSNKMYFCW